MSTVSFTLPSQAGVTAGHSFEKQLQEAVRGTALGIMDFAEDKVEAAHFVLDFDRQMIDSFVKLDEYLVSPLNLRALEAPYDFDKSEERQQLFLQYSGQDAQRIFDLFAHSKKALPRRLWGSLKRGELTPTIVLDVTPKSTLKETPSHEEVMQNFVQNVGFNNWPLTSGLSFSNILDEPLAPGHKTVPMPALAQASAPSEAPAS